MNILRIGQHIGDDIVDPGGDKLLVDGGTTQAKLERDVVERKTTLEAR
jgi:hypothetical protein